MSSSRGARLAAACIAAIAVFLSPFALDAAQSDRELYAEAERRYFSGRYALSLDLYEDFLRDFPLSNLVPDAQYRRALCLFRLDRFAEAGDAFNLVERRYKASRHIAYVPFWQGVISYELGDFARAREKLGAFLETVKDPEFTVQALHYKALAEAASGAEGEARKTMALLAETKGERNLSPYEVVLYSSLLLKDGMHLEVVQFQDRIDLDALQPDYYEKALLLRAEALWNAGEEERASELYRRLLDSEPDAASIAYRRLYRAAQKRSDYAEMERLIQRAEQRFGGTPEALADLWLSIGLESYRRGELDLSQYFLMKVWSLPKTGTVKDSVPLTLADIAVRKGNPQGAERVLAEYLALPGEVPSPALLRTAGIYLRTGNLTEARARLDAVLRKEKDRATRDQALYLLSYAQFRSGEYDASVETISKVIGVTEDENLKRGALRLRTHALKKAGKLAEAAWNLGDYVRMYPGDYKARLDLIRLQFTLRDYEDAARGAAELLAGDPGLEREDLRVYLLVRYLEGLSLVSLKSYVKASESLSAVTVDKARSASIEAILPFVQYYLAWAAYRTNDLKRAMREFSKFVGSYPSHELVNQSLFMEGWCAYSLGDYDRARGYFAQVSKAADGEMGAPGAGSAGSLAAKAKLLEGQSLVNLKRFDEAGRAFTSIFKSNPSSPYADDAMFEYASLLAETGRKKEAVAALLDLADKYPGGALAEEALYKRGEILFESGDTRGAREAFAAFRTRYPEGKLVDAALYWEGVAAYNAGDKKGAAALWETVISGHPRSAFRADALLKASGALTDLGDYKKALGYLDTLKREYPDYAKSVNADLIEEKTRYRAFGLSDKEAELTALISAKGGAKSREGRTAMIELSRVYIFGRTDKIERAFQMLSQVVQEEDPVTGGEAQFLLGEYFWQRKEWETAGREFLKASLRNPDDRKLVASSILRSAQSMKQAGKTREMQELVKRLQEGFPGSPQAEEGRKLLEGRK